MLSASTRAPMTQTKTDLQSHPPGCCQHCTVCKACLRRGGEVVILPSACTTAPGQGQGQGMKQMDQKGGSKPAETFPEVSM